MKSIEFGSYIKQLREAKALPQRLVAHRLNIDTSTLSKIELGERQVTIDMIEGLADILQCDFKDLQIRYITNKIKDDFKGQKYLKEAIENILKQLK